MATERVQVNTLERAASADIMDLQSMAGRQLADVIKWVTALRRLETGFGANTDEPQSIVGGLDLSFFSETQIQVGPGFLAQFGSTELLPGGLDSDVVVGFQRVPVEVDLPVVGARDYGRHYDLLRARVVELVTATATVDIFDVPTQTFIPQIRNKKVELRIEFGWVLAQPNSLGIPELSNSPALDNVGDGWVPIALVNNPLSAFPFVEYYFVGTKLADFMGASELAFAREKSVAIDYAAKLQTVHTPHNAAATEPVNRWVAGMMRGSVQGARAQFSSLQEFAAGTVVAETDGSTFLVDQLQHLYLCPLAYGTRRIMPTHPQSTIDQGLYQGILVRSLVQPSWDLRNSQPIKIGGPNEPGNQWAAHPEVDAGEAIYVGSGYTQPAGPGANTIDWRPAVQARSGELRFALDDVRDISDLPVPASFGAPFLGVIPSAGQPDGPLLDAIELDLRAKVPRCASHVILHFESTNLLNRGWLVYEVRQYVNDISNASVGYPATAHANAGKLLARGNARASETGDDATGVDLTVPVGWVPYPTPDGDATSGQTDYHLRLVVLHKNKQDAVYRPSTRIYLTGWIL